MGEIDFPLAMVTGGAHRLGRAFAISLAKRGHAILLHYNQSETEARKTEKEIINLGVPIHLFQADLTDIHSIELLFTYLDSLPYPLRTLVNSAAIMTPGNIRTVTPPEWKSVMDTNLQAPFLLSQKAAERMKAGGLIVNITDAGAGKAWTGFPAYSVSKAALETLTRILARALAPDIRVNAIAPGLVYKQTSMEEAEWDRLVSRLPLRHSTSETDVTSALDYLLMNQSVTGQTLAVDCGYSLMQ